MEKNKEAVQYCTSCGAANKKSDIFCDQCNRKIILRHRPVVSFLQKRIKGEVTGEATEKVFSLIKKFLLKHLYGAVLTVSVVTTATVSIVTATPYIEKVTSAPFDKNIVVEETAKTEEKNGVFELTEDDIIWLKHVTTAYDAEIDNTLRTCETYWSDDNDYTSATQLWAENNIEGYTYKGTHELYDNPLAMGQDDLSNESYGIYGEQWDEEGFWPAHYRYTPVEGTRTGEDVRSELGHTLLADGYDVMEVDFYCLTYNGEEFEGQKFNFEALPPADKTPYEKYVYTFLLTRKHGGERWHIAEEVLSERVGGPKYRG